MVAILAACLVACNSYKWKSIGGGDANAEAQSNGGYFVRQGKYAYFINGYAGTDADGSNEWGDAVVQSIVRAELDDKGDVKNDTVKVVVPKFIYNSNVNGGFAIYGKWIYYATPNYRKGNTGTASTTDTDFMRTTIDGSVTQLIARIGTRSSQYMFTKNRILYYDANTIRYIDVSGMSNSKSTDKGKGAKEGVLVENVASFAWKYGCDTIFYVRTLTGENSYKHYNELCAINVDGSAQRTLATEDTFLDEGEKPENAIQKVYSYTLRDMYVEQDGSVTIYYAKSYYDSAAKVMGLFMANVKAADNSLKGVTEQQLNTLENASSTSALIYPLGKDKGALAYDNNNMYRYYKANATEGALKVTEASQKIWFVDGDKAYYTAASSATTLLCIDYTQKSTAAVVMTEGIKVDWLALEFVPTYDGQGKLTRLDFYFFATDDENYVHNIDIVTFKDNNTDGEDGERVGSAYLGFAREEKEEEEATA